MTRESLWFILPVAGAAPLNLGEVHRASDTRAELERTSAFSTAHTRQLLDKPEPTCCFFLIWNESLYFEWALWRHILYPWLSFLFEFVTRMKKKIALCLLLAIADPWLKRQALDLKWRVQQTGTRKCSTIILRNSYSLSLGQWHLIWEGPKLKVT